MTRLSEAVPANQAMRSHVDASLGQRLGHHNPHGVDADSGANPGLWIFYCRLVAVKRGHGATAQAGLFYMYLPWR